MEKAGTETEPCIQKEKVTRLVEGNRFKIRRHNFGGFILARDMYHTLLSLNSLFILGVLIVMYVLKLLSPNTIRYFTIAMSFAAIYYGFSPHDNHPMSLPSLGHAFVASLQIQSTIGFAAPVDGHWSRKPVLVIAITLHGITTVLFNIFLLGTLFARLSSAKNRALSVRISSLAVLRETNESP